MAHVPEQQGFEHSGSEEQWFRQLDRNSGRGLCKMSSVLHIWSRGIIGILISVGLRSLIWIGDYRCTMLTPTFPSKMTKSMTFVTLYL